MFARIYYLLSFRGHLPEVFQLSGFLLQYFVLWFECVTVLLIPVFVVVDIRWFNLLTDAVPIAIQVVIADK